MIRATGLLDSAFAWPSGRASLLAAASGSEEYPNHNAVCKTVAADTRRRRRRNRETAAVVFIGDRKSTRLNSSHSQISYAVFCLKKKKYSARHSHVIHYVAQRQHVVCLVTHGLNGRIDLYTRSPPTLKVYSSRLARQVFHDHRHS